MASGQAPLSFEEIPPPPSVIVGLQDDIRRLEKEIEALRGEQEPASTAAETKSPDVKPSFILRVLRGTLWAWGCPCSAPVGSRAKRCRIGSPAVTCSPPGDFATGCSGGRLGNCS